jgi:hypothetical protein
LTLDRTAVSALLESTSSDSANLLSTLLRAISDVYASRDGFWDDMRQRGQDEVMATAWDLKDVVKRDTEGALHEVGLMESLVPC